MWRTGLRVSKVLELEWRGPDYPGDAATLLVGRSKTRKARTVSMRREFVQLFTSWPANRSPRDKVVDISIWMLGAGFTVRKLCRLRRQRGRSAPSTSGSHVPSLCSRARGFSGGLCGIAVAVCPRYRCGGGLYGRVRWVAGAGRVVLFYLETGRIYAGFEHFDHGNMLALRGSGISCVLNGDPVDGVTAPVGTVFRFPVLGAACALGAVGAGGYGDEVLGFSQVVGVEFFLLG